MSRRGTSLLYRLVDPQARSWEESTVHRMSRRDMLKVPGRDRRPDPVERLWWPAARRPSPPRPSRPRLRSQRPRPPRRPGRAGCRSGRHGRARRSRQADRSCQAGRPAPRRAATGSGTKIMLWHSFTGVNDDGQKAMVERFNQSQKDVVVESQFQGNYEETGQKLTAAVQAKTGARDLDPLGRLVVQVLPEQGDHPAGRPAEGEQRRQGRLRRRVRQRGYAQGAVVLAAVRPEHAALLLQQGRLEGSRPAGPWPRDVHGAGGVGAETGQEGRRRRRRTPSRTLAPAATSSGRSRARSGAGAASTPTTNFQVKIAEKPAIDAGEWLRKSVVDGWAIRRRTPTTTSGVASRRR